MSEEGLVAEVHWVESKVQLADALTKKMVPHVLLRALQTSRLPWAFGHENDGDWVDHGGDDRATPRRNSHLRFEGDLLSIGSEQC